MEVARLSTAELKQLNSQLRMCKTKLTRRYVDDIIGFRFGKLLVLKEVTSKGAKRRIYECLCDCGKVTQIGREDLTQGRRVKCIKKGKHL